MAFNQFLYKVLGSALRILIVSAATVVVPFAVVAQTAEKPLLIEKCWEHPTGESVVVSIAADADNVFIAFDNGTVKALGLKDGRDRWSADLGGKVTSNIVVLTDRVLVVTSSVEANGTGGESSTVRALSKETGLTLFSAKVPGARKTYLVAGNDAIVALGSTGAVMGLTLDGRQSWNFAMSSGLAADPFTLGGGITIPLIDRSIQQIGFTNGETISKHSSDTVPMAIAATDNTFYIGDERGRIYSMDAGSGSTHWKFKTGGRVEHIVIGGDRVYAASVDNFIYSISTYKGSVVWKKRLPARVDGRPLIWESMLVVSSFGESSAAIIDAKDGKTIKTIEFGAGNAKTASAVIASDGSVILPLQNGLSVVRFGGCGK
jgi:outer membrane protein assembly factor BamB